MENKRNLLKKCACNDKQNRHKPTNFNILQLDTKTKKASNQIRVSEGLYNRVSLYRVHIIRRALILDVYYSFIVPPFCKYRLTDVDGIFVILEISRMLKDGFTSRSKLQSSILLNLFS